MGLIKDIKPVVNQLQDLEIDVIEGKGDVKQTQRDIRKLRRQLRKIIKESCKLESGDYYTFNYKTKVVRKHSGGTEKSSKLSEAWLTALYSQKIFTASSDFLYTERIFKFV